MMGSNIGLLGGGQLGQMLILAGLPLGLRFVVWDPDPSSPAGKLSTRHFCEPYDSRETLEEFARNSDLVTYEFENIPYPLVAELEQKVSLPQGSSLLSICQHRIREKKTLQKLSPSNVRAFVYGALSGNFWPASGQENPIRTLTGAKRKKPP